MGIYKKIGLSHEKGLIDTAPFGGFHAHITLLLRNVIMPDFHREQLIYIVIREFTLYS